MRLRRGKVDLDSPATTLALLKLNAVVGVKGFFNRGGSLRSIGITCAICHTDVDNSFATGIGKRLDGWPNQDLNIGLIVSLAPNLAPAAEQILRAKAHAHDRPREFAEFDAELAPDVLPVIGPEAARCRANVDRDLRRLSKPRCDADVDRLGNGDRFWLMNSRSRMGNPPKHR